MDLNAEHGRQHGQDKGDSRQANQYSRKNSEASQQFD